MELGDMTLDQRIAMAVASGLPIPIAEVKQLMNEIFKGLAAMHLKGIVHRDLKPDNILLKIPLNDVAQKPLSVQTCDFAKLQLKICDLGQSKFIKDSIKTPYVCTRYYRAPELVLGSLTYGLEVDVWAAGCILFELLARTTLFPASREGEQLSEFV